MPKATTPKSNPCPTRTRKREKERQKRVAIGLGAGELIRNFSEIPVLLNVLIIFIAMGITYLNVLVSCQAYSVGLT